MIKPLADRVLIKPDESIKKTKGGIFIPDVAQEKPLTGEVVAIGTGRNGYPIVSKIGDKVWYNKGAGVTIEYENQKYVIIRQADIILTVE